MQIMDEANSYLVALCNWSPMSKQITECPCNQGNYAYTTYLKQPTLLTVMHVSACYQSVY